MTNDMDIVIVGISTGFNAKGRTYYTTEQKIWLFVYSEQTQNKSRYITLFSQDQLSHNLLDLKTEKK